MSKINIRRAQFSTVPSSGDPLVVHFNPTSLQLVVSNQMEEDRQDHKQYVKKTTAKLTMDLVFDTTDKGEDVRNTTKKIENLMKPKENQRKKKVPPVALFEWGLFKFQGIVESYKETIDFFSRDGVPLRAGINLTLAEQDKVFEDNGQGGGDGSGSGSSPGGATGSGSPPSADAVDVATGNNRNTTDMATAGGDPEAGRDIAAANEEENMRFPSGAMTLDPSVQLGPPVAFASGGAGASLGTGLSAGAGFGIGAKAGIGISRGAGISARAGVGFSAGAGARASIGIGGGAAVSAGAKIGGGGAGVGSGFRASAGFVARGNMGGAAFGASGSASANAGFSTSAVTGPAFGGSASAGVTATEGAFAGLRVKTSTRRFTLDTSRFVQRNESASVTTDSGARFRIGGQATLEASTSLSTDVGAGAGVRGRIQFEEG